MKRNCVGAAGPLLEGGDLRAKSAGATGPDNQNLMGLISPVGSRHLSSPRVLTKGCHSLHVERLREAELHFCAVWSYKRPNRDAVSLSPPNLGYVFQLEPADCFNWDRPSVH